MAGSNHRSILRALVLLILISSGLFLLTSLLSTPAYVRLFSGQEQLLQVLPLFTIRDINGTDGFLIRNDAGVTVRPQSLGRVDLELRFLDIITLRQMVVEVVPQLYVRPGGQAIGILLSTQGLIVSRTVPVVDVEGREFYPARDGGILPGDIVEEIAGQPVRSVQHIAALIDTMAQMGKEIPITVRRGGNRFTVRLRAVLVRSAPEPGDEGPRYMLGMILEEPTAGVGTLTFLHGSSGKYGALGHLITTPLTSPAPISDGRIVRAQISEIRRGYRGSPGEKKGTFRSEKDAIGTIEKNTKFGVFGRLTGGMPSSRWQKEVPVALATDVRVGPAEILTVLDGEEVESFAVEIMKVNPQNRPDDKGIVLRVIDERLLNRTGGIIQGMSGSPILQNGALVGAVTHVFVNDPERGFGVFAEWMLQEAGLWDTRQLGAGTATDDIPMAA
ncbi:MAG: SpoIVB peptidase [Firmicutes bacterium]|nr:SpoIVB peptidase [Bacillota bacterium]